MSKELIENRNDLITRMEDLVNAAKGENRSLSDDEANEIENLRSQVKGIDKTLEIEDMVEGLEKIEREEKGDDLNMNEKELQERQAFENYLRGRIVNERSGELAPSSGSAGALIPTTILNYIIDRVYDICPILARSQKFNVRGKLEIPFYPANANNITVDYASEFSDLDSTSGKFDTVELGGFLAGALTKVSRSLVNNVNFDIVGYVVDRMAYEIARWIEGELLHGTASKITGLSDLSNKLEAASASAITADEIIELHDKIKDQFQPNAIWIMSPATRTAVRLLKDNVGRYLFNDDPTAPFGATILGKPVYVSDNMPDIASGKDVIFYGDMTGLATKFSEEASVEVLRERYAPQHAIGVVGWVEVDAKVINEQQIAKLTMAVSSS